MKTGTPTKLALSVLVFALIGCGKEDPGATPPPVEDRIAAIRNNPKIPEASKKIAIGMLEKQKSKGEGPKPDR